MKTHRITTVLTATLLAFVASNAHAGDRPHHTSTSVHARTNSVRIIRSPKAHPGVAVSRTLAAQPVHPHMIKVRTFGQTTYIDPMARLHGEYRLDEDHSLVKAQRLARSLRGITTSQMAHYANLRAAATNTPSRANTARIIRMPRQATINTSAVLRVRQGKPLFIIPNPEYKPDKKKKQHIPSVPRQPKIDGEKVALISR